MIDITQLLLEIIEQGGIYAIAVLGVYISSRVVAFDDLTIEGSFGVGGALTAYLLSIGAPSITTLFASFCIGALAGTSTALIYRTLPISKVISGIVVTAGLYSISLFIATSFISFAHYQTIFSFVKKSPLEHTGFIIIPLMFIGWLILKSFLKTEIGYLLYALGNNPQMLTNLGKSVTYYTVFGLALSNALTALAGSLFVQYLGFFSITASIGTLIVALTSLMLSEFFGTGIGLTILIGSFIYQTIITTTIALQIDPIWNRLITAGLLIILLAVKKISANRKVGASL